MTNNEYWEETVSEAARDCGVSLSSYQVKFIAEAVAASHENYSLAHYAPPSSERMSDVECKWAKRLSVLQAEYDLYREVVEKSVRRALKLDPGIPITIDSRGDVYRTDGRTEQVL